MATSNATRTMPMHGDVIIFSKVPAGSWCSAGVPYRVDRPNNKGWFRFENVARGSATIDPAWAVRQAVWGPVCEIMAA